MVDFQRFASDVGISTVRQAVYMLRGILVIPLITKLAGADTYGYWVTIIALVGLISTVGGLHMHGALIRYREDDDGRQTLIDTLTIASTVAVLLFSGFLLFDRLVEHPPLFTAIDGAGPWFLTAVGLLSAVTVVFTVLKNVPRARGNILLFEATKIAQRGGEAVVLAVVFLTVESILVALWGVIAVTAALLVGLAVYSLRGHLTTPDFSRFRTYLEYGVPMVPKELSGSLLTHADKFLILYFLSPSATGVYAVCYSLAKLLNNFSSVVNPTLYPTVTQVWKDGEMAALETLYRNVFRGYLFVSVPALAGLTLLAEPVLRLLSTEAIAESGALLVPVLTVGFIFYGFEFALSYVLTAAEETKRIGFVNVVAAAGNVALNVALLPTIGLIGAALSTVVAQLFIFGYLFHRARTHVSFQFPLADAGRACVATVVMTAVLLGLPVARTRMISLALFPVVGVAVYAVALVLIGGISRTEVRRVWTAIR